MRIAPVILAASLVPAAYVAWIMRDQMIGHTHDDGLYAVSGKALAEGRGYRVLSLPGEPYQTKYPPLMPALIAALMPLAPEFPRNPAPVVWVVWLFLPLLTLTFYAFLVRAGTPSTGAAGLAAMVTLSPLMAYFSATLLTDVSCTALIVLTLWLTQRAADPGAGAGRATLAGVAGALAILMRTAAAPLLLASPLWLALQGKRRSAAMCLAAMTPAVVSWLLWSRQHRPANPDSVGLYYLDYTGWYFEDLRAWDIWLFLSQNAGKSLMAFSNLLGVSLPEPRIDLALGILLGAAVVSGAIRWARAGVASPYHYFTIGYLPLVLIWHYRPDPRFVIPVFPFYVAALGWELAHLVRSFDTKLRPTVFKRASAIVFAVALTALTGWILLATVGGLFFQLPAEAAARRQLRESLDQGFAWMRKNTPPEAKVLSFYDPMVYLFTGRQGVQQPRSPKPFYRDDHAAQVAPFFEWPDFCRRYGLDYLVLTTMEIEGAMPAKDYARFRAQVLDGGAFEKMFGAPGIEIYRLTDTWRNR